MRTQQRSLALDPPTFDSCSGGAQAPFIPLYSSSVVVGKARRNGVTRVHSVVIPQHGLLCHWSNGVMLFISLRAK
jgi:hypothetical protein